MSASVRPWRVRSAGRALARVRRDGIRWVIAQAKIKNVKVEQERGPASCWTPGPDDSGQARELKTSFYSARKIRSLWGDWKPLVLCRHQRSLYELNGTPSPPKTKTLARAVRRSGRAAFHQWKAKHPTIVTFTCWPSPSARLGGILKKMFATPAPYCRRLWQGFRLLRRLGIRDPPCPALQQIRLRTHARAPADRPRRLALRSPRPQQTPWCVKIG